MWDINTALHICVTQPAVCDKVLPFKLDKVASQCRSNHASCIVTVTRHIVWISDTIYQCTKALNTRGSILISKSIAFHPNILLNITSTKVLLDTLPWRHNERDGISNHRRLDGLLNRLFRHRSKKTSKLRVTGLCEGNSPVTGEFPSQRDSNAENVSIWWRYHETHQWLVVEYICISEPDYHSLMRSDDGLLHVRTKPLTKPMIPVQWTLGDKLRGNSRKSNWKLPASTTPLPKLIHGPPGTSLSEITI